MRNQIELLRSPFIQGWIRQEAGSDLSLSQQLLRLQHTLLNQAQHSRDGNLSTTLPLREDDPEAAVVFSRFAAYVDQLADVHGVPRVFAGEEAVA